MKNCKIHSTAVIDEGCKIGENCQVWHFSHVSPGASIGDNTKIGAYVYIGKDVSIGKGVKIQNHVSVYESVTLEDDVFVGPQACFTNVINPRSAIERKHEFKATLVKKGATVGANATLVCGITIGQYALIGAGAVVSKDVPDFALVYGVPAKQKGWMCVCGNSVKIQGQKGSCKACNKKYVLKRGVLSLGE
jgi:UDP-2-acetamido-3-amino-2,3-dideoxy-glucuronate N-acetyltransferase